MEPRRETLRWGIPHTLELTDDGHTVQVKLIVRKANGTQEIPAFNLPGGIHLEQVLEAWRNQENNWLDLYEPVKAGGLFAVTRAIDLGRYRILWFVLHVNEAPQDACAVLLKPTAA